MHSSWLNFSHGKSSIGTRIGQASTHRRQPPFEHFTGSLRRPMKLNLFRIAIIAPCGQKYRHQPLGTRATNTRTPIKTISWGQKTRGTFSTSERTVKRSEE